MTLRRTFCLGTIAATLLLAGWPVSSQAYVDAPPPTFGRICDWSTHVIQVQVDSIDAQHGIVIWKKTRELKGRWPGNDRIQQNLTKLPPTAQAAILKWCTPGRTTLMVALESYKWGHTYVDNVWYASHTDDWKSWLGDRLEPLMLRSYAGRTDKLQAAMAAMLAGREVVVPCLADGPLQSLLDHSTRVQSLRASLKLLDYKPERDFVHWGAEEFTPLRGMPAFNRICTLPRVSDARAISAADFDSDGRVDLCLVGAGRIALLQNTGDAFMELPIAGLSTGARAVCWADFDGDGKPDLFVATPAGPRLFHNRGGGDFEDVTPLLPPVPYWSITAATWIDYDGDGKPDLLVADRYQGLRLYRNLVTTLPLGAAGSVDRFKQYVVPAPLDKNAPPPPPKPPVKVVLPPMLQEVSAQVGLGATIFDTADGGAESLTVADVNGDGRPDILVGSGHGVLLLNTPHGFTPVASGISFDSAHAAPVFCDLDNTGLPSLFVPQFEGHCKLYRNDGQGHFTDVTNTSGDLANPIVNATSAAFGDFSGNGRFDLFVGCLNGPNHLLRNDGAGHFSDVTIESGLFKRIFNTQSVSVLDVNQDGTLDVVLNNEGQESVVLLGNPDLARSRTAVTIDVAPRWFGGRFTVKDAAGMTVATRQVATGQGRGGQSPPQLHVALFPGKYRVEERSSDGALETRAFEVGRRPVAVTAGAP